METRVAELAALTAPEQLPAAVLDAVGGPELLLRIQDDTGPPTTARLVTALGGRELLLVLDNCEHLVDGVARSPRRCCGACPLLRVLATSREPLGVPGEVLHPVAPLDRVDAAAELFVDRAAAAVPGFAPRSPTSSRPSPRSAAGSTANRCPSSWRRPGCAR